MKQNLEILVNFFALATLGVKGLRTEPTCSHWLNPLG